jgi:hypothetical protein
MLLFFKHFHRKVIAIIINFYKICPFIDKDNTLRKQIIVNFNKESNEIKEDIDSI